MASSHRLERINGRLQRDLSLILANKIKDDRILNNSIGVTSVKATPDLKEAVVYVSIIGSDETKKEVLKALKHASGFIRSEISKDMPTYQTPAFRFKLDDSYEYGQKIEKILGELRETGQISDELPEEDEEF